MRATRWCGSVSRPGPTSSRGSWTEVSMVARAKDLARSSVKRYRQRRVWDAQMHPRLAFFAPLPPAATGVATYSRAVLDGLRRIGFFERHRIDVVWPPEPRHEGLVPWYRLGV